LTAGHDRIYYKSFRPIMLMKHTHVNALNHSSFISDSSQKKLKNNNIFTVAKRTVEGQDMLYQSLKLTNGIWVLAELKVLPGNKNFTVST
jgi:hypothetical protein